MKKKIVILAVMLALCATAVVGLSACEDPVKGDYKIGIVQEIEHGALDAAREGFQTELTRLMTEAGKTVGFDYKNAQSDKSMASNIVDGFVARNRNMVFSIGTAATQIASTKTKEKGIPTVFTAVTSPVESNIVASMDAPGANVTGTTDLVDLEKQLDVMIELLSDVKTNGIKFGMLYTSAEPNSKYQVEQMKRAIEGRNAADASRGYSYVEKSINEMADVQAAIKALKNSACDVVFIPTDNMIASAVAKVMTENSDEANGAKLPILCGDIDMTAGCGVATIGVNFYDLGVQTAKMAFEILVGGKDPATYPVEKQLTYELHIYEENAAKIGFSIPQSLKDKASR